MKEYKVLRPKLGHTNWHEKFDAFLNQYAREGWTLKFVSEKWTMIIFEREKNR